MYSFITFLLRSFELEMVELVAEFARVNLKLIRKSPDLIPQEAIELVIEVVLPEN